MKEIIFFGHFDIGEKCTSKTKHLLDEVKHLEEDFIVLVGDIGVDVKFINYIQGGIDGLYNTYLQRFQCANSTCIRDQIITSYDDFLKSVDASQYEMIKKEILVRNPILLDELMTDNPPKTSTSELRSIIKDVIDEQIIPQRLAIYGLKNVVVVSERNLRNVVSQRLKKKRNKNWIGIIDKRQILTENENPSCRGIMFALFEKLVTMGYREITFFIEFKHLSAITKGWLLFQYNQHKLLYLDGKLSLKKITTDKNTAKKKKALLAKV